MEEERGADNNNDTRIDGSRLCGVDSFSTFEARLEGSSLGFVSARRLSAVEKGQSVVPPTTHD